MLSFYAYASFAQPPQAADIDLLKVAYIYNFSKYFTWPETDEWRFSFELNICINNSDVAYGSFSSLEGKVSQGKKIHIITLNEIDTEIKIMCHIMYLEVDGFSEYQENTVDLQSDGVLTVSDYKGFSAMGGIIELIEDGNLIKFKINTIAANRNGLKVSALLLELGVRND